MHCEALLVQRALKCEALCVCMCACSEDQFIAVNRPEQLAVPPVTGMLPMSFTAALLMANTGVPMGQQPGQLCQTAIPLPRRPLDLPLSSPSLLEGEGSVTQDA